MMQISMTQRDDMERNIERSLAVVDLLTTTNAGGLGKYTLMHIGLLLDELLNDTKHILRNISQEAGDEK